MTNSLRHFRALISIYLQDGLAYKASGFIWVLTDVSTAATMPIVLSAAAKGQNIGGFDSSSIAVYYLVMLFITSFVQSHFMWEVAFEVKEGIFSSQIIRPVPYLQFMAARNLAWRMMRTMFFFPMFLILLWAYSGMIHSFQLHISWVAIAAIVLGHLVSFFFVMAFAMLALFLQEATSVFELYYVPMLFLSGQLFPIALFPQWVQNISKIFPFYYTTGLPTEIVVGRISEANAIPLLGVQLLWIVGSLLAFKWLFAKGTKQYTGVGM